MELFTKIIIGLFAAFVLNHSITVDKDQEGPFYIYNWVRAKLQSQSMPALVRENHDCPVCGSFWSSALVAVVTTLTLPHVSIVNTLAMLFLMTYGFHGAIIFWFRFLKTFFQIGSREF